jgi:AcrR family transcriptional regulator
VAVKRGELRVEDIQDAAHRIAVAEGLDAISMRKVADAVGVWPTALYHHVGDKDRLVELVLDAVLAEVAIPDDELAWGDWLRAFAHHCREVLLRHPGVATHLLTVGNPSPAAVHVGDRCLGVLRRDGFSAESAAHVYATYLTYVFARTWQDEQRAAATTEVRAKLEGTRSQAATPPHWAEAVDDWLSAEPGALFEHGLETFLRGAASLR